MIENSENELSKKQEYLRIEIMEKGFDTELFTENMQKKKRRKCFRIRKLDIRRIKTICRKIPKRKSNRTKKRRRHKQNRQHKQRRK